MANRLDGGTTPLLLQRACNSVDGYPWGMEALERARVTTCPLLLSVGIATYHGGRSMDRASSVRPITSGTGVVVMLGSRLGEGAQRAGFPAVGEAGL